MSAMNPGELYLPRHCGWRWKYPIGGAAWQVYLISLRDVIICAMHLQWIVTGGAVAAL